MGCERRQSDHKVHTCAQSSYRLPVLITEKSSETCSSLIMRKQNHYPGGSDSKESAYNVWDPGSIPGSGRPPGEGTGYALQCSCLENPRDRGAWWAAIYGVAQSRTRLKRLSSSSSSILACRITRTEEPGGLAFMGSKRVRHDWAQHSSVYMSILNSQSIHPISRLVCMFVLYVCVYIFCFANRFIVTFLYFTYMH